MIKKIEKWKEYPINKEFEGFYRIEISDHGNIRTFSKINPQGKLVKGSLQGGFRILRAKLRKKWSETDLRKIDQLNTEINTLNTEIANLKSNKEFEEKVTGLRQSRDRLIQKRKKLNTKLTNKNTINFALLFHKGVAELFLEKPKSADQKFVIHKDFDKLNNNADNLEWASQSDLDARMQNHPKVILKKFKEQFREANRPNTRASKLSEMEVLRIKARLKKGDSLRHLAKHYNVSDMQIHRIKTGENWGHVKLIEDLKESK